jgi:hypothetical protein
LESIRESARESDFRVRERLESALRGWVEGGVELRRTGVDTLDTTLQLNAFRHDKDNGARQLEDCLRLAPPERCVGESDSSAAGTFVDAVRLMRGIGVTVVGAPRQ